MVLGVGDSFHLVPRAVALCTTGLENYIEWLSDGASPSLGIYRNIPFAMLGLLVIVLFYRGAKGHGDRAFAWMWLTIVLRFGFYIPVVLWADAIPLIGMLMIEQEFLT